MDYLFGRISTLKHDNTRLLLSEVATFENLEVVATLPYNDERKLQTGEWFCIEKFSEKEYFNKKLYEEIEKGKRKPISWEEYGSIKYLIAVQDDENIFHYQRILPKSKIIQRKGIRYYNDHAEMIDVENMLTINSEPDATFIKDEDKLLFKDLSRIRPIFSGIEVLFREATYAEVNEFLNLGIINLQNGFNTKMVSMPNRRRISNAISMYNSFDDDQKQTLGKYIADYCPDIIDADTSSVNIGSDENLKKFIYAIDQRYYSTPINKQKRVATSIENI